MERGVAAPVITESLYARFSSQHPDSFGPRMIAALRNQFGGHKFFEESAGAEVAAQQQAPDADAAGEPAAAS